MASSKKDFSFPQLALMNWLMEKPDRFISVATFSSSSKDLTFHEVRIDTETNTMKAVTAYPQYYFGSDQKQKEEIAKANLDFLKRIGGKAAINTQALVDAQFFTHHSSFTGSKYSSEFLIRAGITNLQSTRYDLPLRAMKRYWENEGKAAYEEELARQIQNKAKVSRTIVIGCPYEFEPAIPKELKDRWPKGIALPYPKVKQKRPVFTATVTKVTANRFQIEDVEQINDFGYMYGVSLIKGRKPNQFVERSDVIVDYADEELIAKLVALDVEFQDDISRISTETMEKMLPLIENIDSRFKQKQAEHDDMLKELVEHRKIGVRKGPTN